MRIIAGEWRGRRIAAPKGDSVRPTLDRVREAWMSMVHTSLPEARVLDLFAGSGALGLEALSRGAASVDFVENDPRTFRVLKENLKLAERRGSRNASPRRRHCVSRPDFGLHMMSRSLIRHIERTSPSNSPNAG